MRVKIYKEFNMSESKGKIYWELDAKVSMKFHTHLDVLAECFGVYLKSHRKGTWRLPENENWMVWFPHEISEDTQKKGIEWFNTISSDDENIYERAKQSKNDYLQDIPYMKDCIRLVFMEIPAVGAYVFKGAFVGNPAEMKEGDHTFTRIATRVRLIGNPVYDIELLDEDRSKLKMPYEFIRPEGASIGQFDSWVIKNDVLAAKETDKSVFEHHGSGIPKETRWYFEADNLSMEDRLDITLVYENVEYKAYIKREASLGRTRMFWYSDLSEKLNDYYKMQDTFPILLFVRDGQARYKISFLEGFKKKLIEPLDENHTVEEKEEHAQLMDIESLKNAAKKHTKKKPVEKIVEVKQVNRDPYIAEYAKRKAEGVCQLCEQPAPFTDKKGKPYLESHHIIWLKDGGEDSIENTVALCPNCHRRMHIIADVNDVAILQKKKEMQTINT